MHQQPIIAIVGPTASGKSELGIALALKYDGEIINCDSVQVYQAIEIATAKVPLAERRGVPHHLLDFVPPQMGYTAGEWARDAAKMIADIERRAHMALLVGGSGFYLRALREPLYDSAPTDETLRHRLREMRERRGAVHLYKILQRLDPDAALTLHARDWSRVQRALEVRLQTGRTLAAERIAHKREPPAFAARIHIFALNPPRSALYERINRRTELHFRLGLIEEVRRLLAAGVPAESTALGAHGYRRAVEFLRGRRASIESAVEQTQLDVRHYAKRQLTWFRRESGVEWIEGFGDDPQTIERVARRVGELLPRN